MIFAAAAPVASQPRTLNVLIHWFESFRIHLAIGDVTLIDFSPHSFMLDVPWAFPASETLHFMGLTLLLGSLLVVDMRALGLLRQISFKAAHKMIGIAIAGFSINLFTGTMFLFADPNRYFVNVGLRAKLVLVLLAGANALLFELVAFRRSLPGFRTLLIGGVLFLSGFAAALCLLYAQDYAGPPEVVIVALFLSALTLLGKLIMAVGVVGGVATIVIGAAQLALHLVSGKAGATASSGEGGAVTAAADGAAVKTMAALSIVFWLSVLVLGRFMPYVEY